MPLRRSALAAILAIPLVLAACGNDDQDTAPTTTSSVTSTSSATSTTSSTSSSTTEEPAPVTEDQAAVEPEPAPEAAPEPQGIWAPTGQGYQCPQTDAFVWDPANCTPENLGAGTAPDPATVPYAEGGTCAAAVCGYGYDEYGNRNPSSGEIQGRHLCQDGYIDDPEYCAAIEDVFANNVDYRDWE